LKAVVSHHYKVSQTFHKMMYGGLEIKLRRVQYVQYIICTFHLNSIPALKCKLRKLWLFVVLKFNFLMTKTVQQVGDLK